MTLATLRRFGPAPSAGAWLAARRGAVPGWAAQLARFGVVGGAASVVQLALYGFLADGVGSQPANVVSWLMSTLLATEAHRRYSFRTSGDGVDSDHVVGIATSLVTLLLSTVALAALDDPDGSTGVLALVAVNAAVGLLRFAALRWWMVGRRAHAHDQMRNPVRTRTRG